MRKLNFTTFEKSTLLVESARSLKLDEKRKDLQTRARRAYLEVMAFATPRDVVLTILISEYLANLVDEYSPGKTDVNSVCEAFDVSPEVGALALRLAGFESFSVNGIYRYEESTEAMELSSIDHAELFDWNAFDET